MEKARHKFILMILLLNIFILTNVTQSISKISNYSQISPDLIYYNGTIITMDDNHEQVEAVAVSGEKILAIGTIHDIVGMADTSTVFVDLEGNTLLPGFIDAHSHWIGDRNLVNQSTAQEAIQSVVENGWTSISELFVNEERMTELRTLDENNELHIRVNAYLPLSWQFERFGNWYQQYQPGYEYSSKLRVAGAKIFADRWIGNRTLLYFDELELTNLIQEAHNLGYQIAIHSASSEATDMVLNAYESVMGTGPKDQYRPRIEHLVLLRDDQIQRLKDLDIIASFQLTWFTSDYATEYADFIGQENVSYFIRWRDIVRSGVTSMGSTDYPWNDGPFGSVVEVINNAVTKVGPLGLTPPDWMLNQTLTVEETLRLMTINAAYGTFQEDVKGSITEGKFADFVILSGNPITTPNDQLINLKVISTIIGGTVEFCGVGYSSLCTGGFSNPSSSTMTSSGGNTFTTSTATTIHDSTSETTNVSLTNTDSQFLFSLSSLIALVVIYPKKRR